MREQTVIQMSGHIKAYYPDNGEVLLDVDNGIHYENMSEALAQSLADRTIGYIHEMHFGNGGTSVDPTGVIAYLPPNITGQNADLYNPTYFKVVDDLSSLNTDPTRNFLDVRHTVGAVFTDILVSCLLDFGEPAGQQAFDNTENLDGEFVFDELGLKTWSGTAGDGQLLSHAVFHPAQKALNRLLKIDYTLRIQSLTNLSSNA